MNFAAKFCWAIIRNGWRESPPTQAQNQSLFGDNDPLFPRAPGKHTWTSDDTVDWAEERI
ncbi:hypothetical protein H5410_015097 [Solanum commersonii]|uniref:Uncharacterized protein n=1 Tax=Solanum commersonii TaxID=4109 RepID=A0A9J5ZSU0_SOLCO|nr:hypothetical protein H5410_015097 [Solanum commersonii]